MVHAGAGSSTATGLKDMPGKKGVSTELKKQQVKKQTFFSTCSTNADPKLEPSTSTLIDAKKTESKDDHCADTVKPFNKAILMLSHMAFRA